MNASKLKKMVAKTIETSIAYEQLYEKISTERIDNFIWGVG